MLIFLLRLIKWLAVVGLTVVGSLLIVGSSQSIADDVRYGVPGGDGVVFASGVVQSVLQLTPLAGQSLPLGGAFLVLALLFVALI
jgi:hypothetical protein